VELCTELAYIACPRYPYI